LKGSENSRWRGKKGRRSPKKSPGGRVRGGGGANGKGALRRERRGGGGQPTGGSTKGNLKFWYSSLKRWKKIEILGGLG